MRQQAGIPARMVVTDQTGAAADLNKEQYAQVMGAYNAFQHRVKTSIIQVHSERASLPGGGQVEMRHSFGTNTVRVMVPKAMAPAIKGKTIIVDADFLVITYGFSAEDGQDLDTRTKIVAPFNSDELGWAREERVTIAGNDVAVWGGDNTGHGEESVYLSIKDITAAHGLAKMQFEFRAFWFYERLRGDCNLQVRAYNGGEMVLNKDAYSFANVGGIQVASISKSINVSTAISDDVAGELIASVVFNPATNALTLL